MLCVMTQDFHSMIISTEWKGPAFLGEWCLLQQPRGHTQSVDRRLEKRSQGYLTGTMQPRVGVMGLEVTN